MGHWMEGDWPEDAEVESAEDIAIKRLIRAAHVVLDRAKVDDDPDDEVLGELGVALDDVEALYEDDDPRSMGWVGDDGLP